jgi:protein-tyrosine kinase
MSIVERAGAKMARQSAKSIVELAADRLGGAADATNTAAPQMPPTVQQESIREISVDATPQPSLTIDFDRLRARGFALPRDHSTVAEEFRLIKRPLLSFALSHTISPVQNRNVMMVTSAAPNEGKTFVATNLAFSIASEHNIYVLLIDADVAKPSIPNVLGFESERGMLDVVAHSNVDVADVLLHTNIENLSVLPAGAARPGMTELIASARMARFVSEISQRYSDRVIIFDSPPMLARSEASVLAKHVGQVVLVVEAERTSRTAIEETLTLVGRDRIGGVVLNKAPRIMGQEGFGQGYSYGYYYGS